MKNKIIRAITKLIVHNLSRKKPKDPEIYLEKTKRMNQILDSEDSGIRPRDKQNRPGGLVNLEPQFKTIIVPDLHGRIGLLATIFLDGEGAALHKLEHEELQVLFLGDGFHGELRALSRWKQAYMEYLKDFKDHGAMDEEMAENLGAMEIIMELKAAFPRQIHFLKGNHENIANEKQEGNFSFYKFVEEGAMVKEYFLRFMGDDLFNAHYHFEKNLPLLAVGRNFLASHAEPARFFSSRDIINYRGNEKVIAGLTWTDNDAAATNSVQKMLKSYLPASEQSDALYFGGHRIIKEKYVLRANGQFVQIHNPNEYIIALLPAQGPIDLDKVVINLVAMDGDKLKA
ncbi:MAG: metallophosphoesterase [Spirochaetales bacterium]|nr:metallophosphoesterase [Spirochaetales bacterium]